MDVFLGWVAGTAAFVVGLLLAVSYSEQHWHQEIRYRHTHPQPGWAVHEGTVVRVAKPDFAYQPPETRAVVRFTDYFGKTQTTSVMMPYRIAPQNHTEVDVHNDGQIYAPQSYDYGKRGDWRGPRSAAAGMFPAGFIFLVGIVANMCVACILGVIVTLICELLGEINVPNVRGRLGTR